MNPVESHLAEAILMVQFEGEAIVVDPSDDLVFGRGAALDVDSNPFLHRRVGRFVRSGGLWWVENLSDWSPVRLVAARSSTVVGPRERAPIQHSSSSVTFGSGACCYEIRLTVSDVPARPEADDDDLDPHSTATLRFDVVDLTADQRMLVVALAERRLRDPLDRSRLPGNAEVAARLGWTISKFNRKLELAVSAPAPRRRGRCARRREPGPRSTRTDRRPHDFVRPGHGSRS